jgi:bacteriocin-like protein
MDEQKEIKPAAESAELEEKDLEQVSGGSGPVGSQFLKLEIKYNP